MALTTERALYRSWGWRDDLPDPDAPPLGLEDVRARRPDIHDESEADDAWLNWWMFTRTGRAAYRERGLAWVRYYDTDYLTQPEGLASCGASACHVYGWGAVALDQPAVAEKIAAYVEPLYRVHTPGAEGPGWGGNLRGVSRTLLLASSLAAVPRWRAFADFLAELFERDPSWDARGFWPMGENWVAAYFGEANKTRRGASPMHLAWASWATSDYAARFPGSRWAPGLASKVQALARWTKALSIPADPRNSGAQMIHDPVAFTPVDDPAYFVPRVDMLARGGDLETAREMWRRGSGGTPGRMINADVLSQQPYYFAHNHGDGSYTHALVSSDTPAPAPTGWRWRLAKGTTQPNSRGYSGSYDGVLVGGGHGGNRLNTMTQWLREQEDWRDQFDGEDHGGPGYFAEQLVKWGLSENPIDGGASVPFLTPHGRLYVQHWYQKVRRWPARDGWLMVGAANTALYRAPDTWTMLAGANAPGNPHIPYGGDQSNAVLLDADPDLPDVMTFIVTSAPHAGMWRIGADDRWAQAFPRPDEVNWHALYSTYVKMWRAHLVHAVPDAGPASWWRVSAVTGEWRRVLGLDHLRYPAFAANADGTKVVVVHAGVGVQELDTASGEVATLAVTGTPPNLRTDPDNLPNLWEDGGRFGFLEYGGQSGPMRTFLLEPGDGPIPPPPSPPPGDTIMDGYLDQCSSAGAVVGWARDPAQLTIHQSVTVKVDGTDVLTLTAKDPRPDVSPTTGYGFAGQLPKAVMDGSPHQVSAWVGRHQLNGSPTTVTLVSGTGPPPATPPSAPPGSLTPHQALAQANAYTDAQIAALKIVKG